MAILGVSLFSDHCQNEGPLFAIGFLLNILTDSDSDSEGFSVHFFSGNPHWTVKYGFLET